MCSLDESAGKEDCHPTCLGVSHVPSLLGPASPSSILGGGPVVIQTVVLMGTNEGYQAVTVYKTAIKGP
jgi:hypothetical protein